MNELEKYPELLTKIEEYPGLKDEIALVKLKFKSNRELDRILWNKVYKNDLSAFHWQNLIKYIKRGYDVKYSLCYAQDIYSLQLMYYFGAKPFSRDTLEGFHLNRASLFILELFWSDISNIFYQPQRNNEPVYMCNRIEIFNFLHKKGVNVDNIAYPEKLYTYKKRLYTYELVMKFWKYSSNLTKREYVEQKAIINFIVYEFDDFRLETCYEWRGHVFIVPKWFLYFREYFKPEKDYAGFDISWVPLVWEKNTLQFFKIFNDLNIKERSSQGINMFVMLLDCKVDNMIIGIEHLLSFGLDPLQKDVDGISFFDILVSCGQKFVKAIDFIESKIDMRIYMRKQIILDVNKKTRIYPISNDQIETSGIESSNVKENSNVRNSNELAKSKIEKKPNTLTKTNQLENTVTAMEVNKRLELKQLTADQRYTLSIMKNYFKASIVTKCNELFQLNETKYDRSLFNGIEHTILYFLLLISKTSEKRELFTAYKEISFKLSNLKNKFENEELINEMIIFFKRLYIITNKVTNSSIVNEEKLFVIDVFEFNRYTIFSIYLSYVFIDMESITTTIKVAKETGLDNNAKFDLYWPRIYECTTDISSYLIKSMLFPFGVDLEDNYKHRIIADQIKLEGKL